MRVLAIRGKNLASLEGEFEIDFTTEPLKSSGIFAITGNTGSGKSTLLDALCLALFDNTPRTKSAADSIAMTDVKDKTISHKDSRNILRRGTGEGYAEVDFMSLGGELYRSQWVVHRSRDKAEGALQPSEIRLHNLTSGTEEQGGKKELLARIVDLIGLTVDQFTRAVLLAQGDFATFLKAPQRDKAELLEKLTGTEIYSRISSAIYEKSKAAELELNRIKERISDIDLLSEENIEALKTETKSLADETVTLAKKIELLKTKIKWSDDEADLSARVIQVQQALAASEKIIADAKTRYDYLSQVDNVLEIRDSFNELKTTNSQLSDNQKNISIQEEANKTNSELLTKISGKIKDAESELKQHNDEWLAIAPQIKAARELDVRIVELKKIVSDAEREYLDAKTQKDNLEKTVAQTQTSIATAKEQAVKIDSWFEQNDHYKNIVPRIDLIVNLADDTVAANEQVKINSQILDETKLILEKEQVELTALVAEAERLNNLLPAEIISLRTKLRECEPCPVCGSIHHPFGNVHVESIEESELNRAKIEVADNMAALTERVSNHKGEIIRLESLTANYAKQSEDGTNKLTTYLASLPEWETMFREGNLQSSLCSIAEKWGENESEKSRANEQITDQQTALSIAQSQLKDIVATCSVREAKHKEVTVSLHDLLTRRGELLDGRNVDQVEVTHDLKDKELSGQLSELKDKQSGIIAANEKQTGVINQIQKEITRLSKRSADLTYIVEKWLSTRAEALTMEQLAELLARDTAWIADEREALNRLHQQRTTAVATLAERTKALENHRVLKNKPTEEETKDLLQSTLSEKEATSLNITSRNAEIAVLLATHEKNKVRIASFEKELTEKGALSENWKKLNEMFGSADGTKFKVLAQGYTLDALLAYANKHLRELSKRYEIQRIPDTLALQVVDLDMLGEIRTVHSLSGGESFLVSLALALGLSSLSSNRMKVESLFIDEGFGSLDIDTLRIAMDALERLQTQGRKIGVISHVAEMTERISTQIQVIKTVNGKSRIEIIG